MTKTAFIAPTHGFKFVNRFEFDLGVSFQLPLVSAVNLGDIVYGLCGGMCFASLDYFYSEKKLPPYSRPEDIPTSYLLYLWDRQLDSLRLLVVPKVIEWMLRDDNDVGRRTVRYEVPKLRRRLDKGQPVVLALIRARGLDRVSKNHQVMAVDYEEDLRTRQMTIHLYDPNHPGKQPKITLDLSRPSRGINIKQSTGEALRGFFMINYRWQAPRETGFD